MLRKTVLVRALSIAFTTAALAAAVTQPAMAQSNTVGIIFGTVPVGSATSVNLRNTDTNLNRTVQVDGNGKFQASGLPIGHYRATLMNGTTAGATSELDVIAGQGSEAIFATAGAVQSVQVQGRRTRIDVSNTNNGAVFTARELARLPIAPSVASIVQLAPNTTRGDPRYAAGDSFGGGGPSENAYYINGFPVTNPLTQLGASELPFGAIAQAQVLTGGFGAEFGRSVGGVVNITTKSGTNNWEVGAQYSIEPNAWRSKSKNYLYEKTGALENVSTDGKVRLWREDNTRDLKRIGAYVGGPLIKDKLFMFLSGETTNTDTNFNNTAFTANPTTVSGWVESRAIQDRYVAKVDWNITDNHRIEITKIGDDARAERSNYGFNFLTHKRDDVLALRGNWSNDTTNNGFTPSSGGDVQMLKYTGNITDDFTLSFLTGKSNVNHTNRFAGIKDTSLAGTQIASGGNPNPAVPIPNPNPVTFNITPDGARDEVKANRLDLEYKLGTHTLRAGLDRVKMSSINAGQETPGFATWSYRFTRTPTTPIAMGAGDPVATASGGQSGTAGFYVRKVVFTTVTSAASDQSAEYLEDKWQVTKNLLVTGGVRREGFSNRNGENETFLKQDGNISPRLSAAWDVNGDASFKVYGSAGRYFVQIPTNVTVRGASRATNTQQFFTYRSIDPVTGAPVGLVELTQARSTNHEFGQAKDPRTITATNLKPTYQDEVTLGFEKAYSPSLNFGVKGTYRKLRSTADDYCDQRPFDAWAARNGVSTANWTYGVGCVITNPGEDQTFLVDFNNGDLAIKPTLTTVKLTAAEIGLPKPKRIYAALDFFAEHPLRDGWYGKVNYTRAKNYGNTEGQTNSDSAQANVSITAVWDLPEIMQNTDGLLPNNRTHQIKAFGFYEVTPEWTVGGNFLAASGRPKGCLGVHPDPAVRDIGYGAAFKYCKNAAGTSVPMPRGTLGEYPWDVRLDMNLVYAPAAVKGLSFKLDVFNVANKQTVQVIDDLHENDDGTIWARSGGVMSYTPSRSARFSIEYNKKF